MIELFVLAVVQTAKRDITETVCMRDAPRYFENKFSKYLRRSAPSPGGTAARFRPGNYPTSNTVYPGRSAFRAILRVIFVLPAFD